MNLPINHEDISTEQRMLSILNHQREVFYQQLPVSAEARIDRIERVITMLKKYEAEITSAIEQDFGCRNQNYSRFTDIITSIESLKAARKNLKNWMKPSRRKSTPPTGLFGAKAQLQPQPKGVIGIMSPWNFPIGLIVTPLAGVLAAGNTAMIKPSELTPLTAEVLKKAVDEFFEPTEIAVINGGPDVAQAFSKLPFDHLVFTGSPQLGKVVMQAAAANLVPVTLELGGKCPVIISDQADTLWAAEKLITRKTLNGGQICLSPDYAFIPEEKLEETIKAMQAKGLSMFPDYQKDISLTSICADHHFQRQINLIDEAQKAGTRIIQLGGSPLPREQAKARRQIPLTLIINPSETLKVMQEEIFGPILILKTYRKFEETIEYINDHHRPLALYYFGHCKQEKQKLIEKTISGGMTFNDCFLHVAQEDLPLGGIGNSGMGRYHGEFGFEEFSHMKAVFHSPKLDIFKALGIIPPFGTRVENATRFMLGK